MRFIRRPADYATGNYAAPGKPWDATPKRYTVTDSMLTDGAAPDAAIPANVENTREAWHFDAESVQVHAALKTWQYADTPDAAVADLSIVGIRTGTSETERIPLVLGTKASDTNRVYAKLSADGLNYYATPVLTAAAWQATTLVRVVAGGPGIVFSDDRYSTDYGGTWSAISGAWAPGPVFSRGVHYANLITLGVERYFIAYNGSVVLPYCATPGGAPTNGTFPEGLHADEVEFANDGKQNVVLVARKNGNTFFTIYRTTNGGTSWAKVTDLGSSTAANVTWSDALQLFVAWTDVGQLYASADGSSWNVFGTPLATPANGFAPGRETMVACGPAIVKSFVKTYGSYTVPGVAYTFDLGVSWNVHRFGRPADGAPATLRSFDGRIYARGAANRIHVSGVLGAPVKDL